MKAKFVGLNNICELNVSVIDTNSYEFEWLNWTVQIRAQFTDDHRFVDEYVFMDEEGKTVRGIKTTNCFGESYSYGSAADLIKRFALRGSKTPLFAEDMSV